MRNGDRPSDPAPTELEAVLHPGWLAAALADVESGERIIDVQEVGRSHTLAHKVRVAVTLENRDGRLRTRTYCVKAHFDGASPETLLTEARFYDELRPLIDVRAPRAYYTGINESTGRALIIMDDVLSDGGRFLSAHEPYSPATCRDALGQLARVHAATWEDDRWMVDWLAPRIAGMTELFPVDVLQRLLADGRGAEVSPDLLDAGHLERAMSKTATLPATCVIHGDTHSGNVYLDSAGRACWLDWQVTQRGHWSIDVAYHIATALDIDDRRSHERELLRGYLDALAALGVEPPPWSEAWDRYTLGFTWGYFLWVITRISSRAVVLIHLPRIGATLADHDTFRRLGVDLTITGRGVGVPCASRGGGASWPARVDRSRSPRGTSAGRRRGRSRIRPSPRSATARRSGRPSIRVPPRRSRGRRQDRPRLPSAACESPRSARSAKCFCRRMRASLTNVS